MGVRGELFSTKVSLQNRTYFFNVKENRLGDLYLNMVESKNRDEGGFERQSIVLFAEDLQEFLQGFDESLRVLEKATREKRRPASNREGAPRRSEGRSSPRRFDAEGGGRSSGRRFDSDDRSDRGERTERRTERRSDFERRPRPPFGEDRFAARKRPPGRDDGPRRPRFGEKPARKSRSRDDWDSKPPFPPKKRMVVKKR